jgi:glutamine amidotransferase
VNAVPVAVFDYGSGNLHSVCRALDAAGADVRLTSDPAQVKEAAGLVVPGVGAFAECMAGLRQAGGESLIRDWVAARRPLLGICVGHQILFESGVEHGIDTHGVGLLPGVVEELPVKRLPHMGWNTVQPPADTRLLAGLGDERFYFVHSYGVLADDSQPGGPAFTIAEHEGVPFVAAVEYGPISATQFHPEKSGEAGRRLLRNWLDIVAGEPFDD